MKPIGPLMREHRLIERMIDIFEREKDSIERGKRIETAFLVDAVDFFRTYADRTHHGKEEEILFADLARRDISGEDRALLEELLEEHRRAREKVSGIADAAEGLAGGAKDRLNDISTLLGELVNLYRAHIEKEDKRFFRAAMRYYDEPEQKAMLRRFEEFDRAMIHERYTAVVERYE